MDIENDRQLMILQTDLQNQFVSLFSHLSRNYDSKLFCKELQSLIVSLRKVIMTTVSPTVQHNQFFLLTLLYKMIPYTRDIYGGIADRSLTHRMLFIWNYHFPVPTANCLHKMILPIDNNPPYGSWRDIKDLCLFVKNMSEKGDMDPFIETCIGLMNHQLDKDYKLLDESLDNYNRKKNTPWEIPYPVPSNIGMSLVSKWIPRENSSHKWLFDRCVIQWLRAFKPFYLQSTNGDKYKFKKALNKGKKEYRHICSRLSKAWDTLEIKQCSLDWQSITPTNIPLTAMNKQQQALLNIGINGNVRSRTMNDKDRQLCALKIQKFWLSKKSKNPIFIQMEYIVQNALRVSNANEIIRLNKLWDIVLRQISTMSQFIPVVDLSLFSINPQSFYSAIGMAAAIAMKSNLDKKNIMLFDKGFHLVSIEHCSSIKDIIDTLKPIYHQHHIGSDIYNACSSIIHSIQETKLNDNYVEKLKLVFFTSYDNFNTDIAKNINHMFQFSSLSTPSILFWSDGHSNTPPTFNEDIYCKKYSTLIEENSLASPPHPPPRTFTSRPVYFTGSNNHILTNLSTIPPNQWEHIDTFRFVRFLLDKSTRYLPFDKYFQTLKGAGK